MAARRILLIFLAAVALLVALAAFVRQQVAERFSPDTRNIIFSDHYRLTGTVDGALVVVADTVTLERSSRVSGDLALVARESVSVAGMVDGNLTILGSSLLLDEGSRVSGDLSFMGQDAAIAGQVDGGLTIVGATLRLAENARLTGEFLACPETVIDSGGLYREQIAACQQREALTEQFAPLRALHDRLSAPSAGMSADGLLASAVLASVLTGLAALVVSAFPVSFSRMREAALMQPRRLALLGGLVMLLALGLGSALLLVVAAVPPLGFVLVLLAALPGLALLALFAVGWMALMLTLGDFLLRRVLHTIQPPLVSVIVGALVIFLVHILLLSLPYGLYLALLLVTVPGALGLGAALTTRLGRRSSRQPYFVQG